MHIAISHIPYNVFKPTNESIIKRIIKKSESAEKNTCMQHIYYNSYKNALNMYLGRRNKETVILISWAF